jgi:hypothetical protein
LKYRPPNLTKMPVQSLCTEIRDDSPTPGERLTCYLPRAGQGRSFHDNESAVLNSTLHVQAPLKRPETQACCYSRSTNSLSFRACEDRRSFRNALASIWRTRSLVTRKLCPGSQEGRGQVVNLHFVNVYIALANNRPTWEGSGLEMALSA